MAIAPAQYDAIERPLGVIPYRGRPRIDEAPTEDGAPVPF